MSDSLGFALAIVFAQILPAAIFLYAAYWAFTIRRALVSRIYRSHALWLGTIGIMVALSAFITYSNDPIINDAIGLFYSLIFIALFAFINSTVPVVRRSDPLLRSILNWDRLRIWLWGCTAVLASTNLIPILSPSFANGLGGFVVGVLLWTAIACILFSVSGAALIIGARRSRDPQLRASLKWLGILLFTLVLSFFVSAVVIALKVSQFDTYYSYPALPGGVLLIVGAYALYRSARSLAPINRLPLVEPAPTEGPGTFTPPHP